MKLNIDQQKLDFVCLENNITYLGLFGSYADGNATTDSDVDILVEFEETKSLLEKGKVIIDLEKLFQKEVDLVSKKNIKESIKQNIQSQLITLYEKKR